jgi:hypothetical protein
VALTLKYTGAWSQRWLACGRRRRRR